MTRQPQNSDTIIMIAMGLVASAGAVALYQHGDMSASSAAMAGVASYVIGLSAQLLASRLTQPRTSASALPGADMTESQRLSAAIGAVKRDRAPSARPMNDTSGATGAPRRPSPELPLQANQTPPTPPRLGSGRETSAANPAHTSLSAYEVAGRSSSGHTLTRPVPATSEANQAPKAELPPFVTGRASARGQAPAMREPHQIQQAPLAPPSFEIDPQDVHARHTRNGASQSHQLPPLDASREQASNQHAADTGPREADVELLQDAIKRMLEEVNEADRKGRLASAVAQTENQFATRQAATKARFEEPDQDDDRDDRVQAGSPTRAASTSDNRDLIEQSLTALKMAGETMRSMSALPPVKVAPPLPPFVNKQASHAAATRTQMASPQAPEAHTAHPHTNTVSPSKTVVPPHDARARVLSDAIAAGRIDVALEPILGLEDQQARHYEVSIRLRDANGHALDVFGEGPDLRGTGLLPLFDSMSINQVASIAERLDGRGKVGSVFSRFHAESVADERFVGELAASLHRRASLATQLVLSFTQSDVRDFSTPEWDSLADMRALGFRFAISGISDLDMDFETLAEQGFSFVKLDATVFLRGLQAPDGLIPASDVCRHLAKLGLTLVIEHIATEHQLASIFGFGVLLGQGQLFGAARPVRTEASSAHAAA